jgi:multidrug efflux pump subunit AcrA (membrane-fusion protein)
MPRAAIVRLHGQAWAYVQTDEQTFIRRQVPLDQPAEGGWFIPGGFEPGERVVVGGAQVLLSEELKSQIHVGD